MYQKNYSKKENSQIKRNIFQKIIDKINRLKDKNFDLILDSLFTKSENNLLNKQETNQEMIKKLIQNRHFYDKKSKILSIFPYSNQNIRKLILDLKFHNKKENADFFAEILMEILPEFFQEWEIQENFYKPILITVPIPFIRKIQRGYNQNDLIIKKWLKIGGKHFIHKWEKKSLIKKYRKPQTKTKNKKERLENQKNAFKIKNKTNIKNQNIIIFDDIYTTGATISEIKKELKKNGAKKIITIILAH